MFILTVAPIARGILHGNLTYFAKERPPIGAFIMVPVRTREVPALVLEVSEASDSKSTVKSSDYAIRKISRIKPRRIWSEEFLKAVEEAALKDAQGFGETLLALTPKSILDAHVDGTLPEPTFTGPREGSRARLLATQSTTKSRLESYQRLVRESFIEHKSVFICLPSEIDVERVARELGHGIEDYTYAFTSSMSSKKLLATWNAATTNEHAILAIGTAQYLSLPKRFDTIIIDEEQARTWKTHIRPLVDLRIFVEALARESKSTLIIGASMLRPETHKRVTDGLMGEFVRIFSRAHLDTIGTPLHTEIIDPRDEEKRIRESTGARTFQILSEGIRTLLGTTQEHSQSTLLLSARKGLSPITRCGDCGTVLCCSECQTPLVIHSKKDGTRIFSCHACGFIRIPEDDVHETCPTCGGWKLEGMGIGTERVEQEVRELFPGRPLFVFDGDSIKTSAQAKKMIAQFEKSTTEGRAPILIGTPMVVPYLTTVGNTAVISLDSLFAIPDFRMSERIFAMILSLREKTRHALLVQTRRDDRVTIEQACTGDIASFIREELALRKAFSYPPYGTIIKITLRGKKESVPGEMDRAKQFLNDYPLLIPPTMSRDLKGLYRMHAIIKLPEGIWHTPNTKNFLQKLLTLPHQFTTEVNPDHLL